MYNIYTLIYCSGTVLIISQCPPVASFNSKTIFQCMNIILPSSFLKTRHHEESFRVEKKKIRLKGITGEKKTYFDSINYLVEICSLDI